MIDFTEIKKKILFPFVSLPIPNKEKIVGLKNTIRLFIN